MRLTKAWKNRKKEAAKPEQYHNVFVKSPNGSHILTDMMKAHHVLSSSFEPDPYATAFREGERNVVLRILTILDEYEEGRK